MNQPKFNPGAPDLLGRRAHKSNTMKADELINQIFALGLTNDVAGIMFSGSEPIQECIRRFGEFNVLRTPKENTYYVYEWRNTDYVPSLGEPDAILLQTEEEPMMLVFLYAIEE